MVNEGGGSLAVLEKLDGRLDAGCGRYPQHAEGLDGGRQEDGGVERTIADVQPVGPRSEAGPNRTIYGG